MWMASAQCKSFTRHDAGLLPWCAFGLALYTDYSSGCLCQAYQALPVQGTITKLVVQPCRQQTSGSSDCAYPSSYSGLGHGLVSSRHTRLSPYPDHQVPRTSRLSNSFRPARSFSSPYFADSLTQECHNVRQASRCPGDLAWLSAYLDRKVAKVLELQQLIVETTPRSPRSRQTLASRIQNSPGPRIRSSLSTPTDQLKTQ